MGQRARARVQRDRLTVWWDRSLAPAGGSSGDWAGARGSHVPVLWSTLSVDSEFVLDEAELAKGQNALVGVGIDDVRLPLELGQRNAANLFGWTGDARR